MVTVVNVLEYDRKNGDGTVVMAQCQESPKPVFSNGQYVLKSRTGNMIINGMDIDQAQSLIGAKFDGRIVRKEAFSLEELGDNVDIEPAINPSTNVELTSGGKPFYGINRYTEDPDDQDVVLPRDKQAPVDSDELESLIDQKAEA